MTRFVLLRVAMQDALDVPLSSGLIDVIVCVDVAWMADRAEAVRRGNGGLPY